MMWNKQRFRLAQNRRGLTNRDLVRATGISEKTITELKNGVTEEPRKETIQKLAEALDYSIDFFYGEDIDYVEEKAINFRSLRSIKSKEKKAALASHQIGILLMEWVDKRFDLHKPDVPFFCSTDCSPESAAVILRSEWGIGTKPIENIFRLLESRGIRILSLSEDTERIDAFSFWKNDTPYIFLNNRKTAERSVFDAAHELGHLVLHRDFYCQKELATVEKQANDFASAFLMPEQDVKATLPKYLHLHDSNILIKHKKRWKVSAMALARRCHTIGLLSEYFYKYTCMQLSRLGYRKKEPNGIERQYSEVWKQILQYLWAERITTASIAKDLSLPIDEVESLISGLARKESLYQHSSHNKPHNKAHLKIVT